MVNILENTQESEDSNLGEREKITPKYFLNEQELIRVIKGRLALRHVSNKERALAEKEEGIKGGDALSLSETCGLFDEAEQASILERLDAPRGIPLKLFLELRSEQVMSVLTQSEKDKFLQKYKEGIRIFIQDSLSWDTNELLTDQSLTLGTVVDSLKATTPAFLFISSDQAYLSYDKSAYYGLGKIGKGDIDQKDIKEVLSFSGEDWAEFDQYKDLPLDKNTFEFLIDRLSDKIQTRLKELLLEGYQP